METDLFAGVAVSDLNRAIRWYDRFFADAESFEPNDTERVRAIAPQRHVYVEHQPGHAGHAMVTLFVDDFDAHLAALAQRGIRTQSQERYRNGVRKAIDRDPDGNEIGVRRTARPAAGRLEHAGWRRPSR